MNLGLQGKIAVVSGSTAGIGLAIAVALAAEGARVIINGRTEDRVNAALGKIRPFARSAARAGRTGDERSAEPAPFPSEPPPDCPSHRPRRRS